MKNDKIAETAGFAGLITIFAAAFIIYMNIVQQMIHFIMSLQITGIHHGSFKLYMMNYERKMRITFIVACCCLSIQNVQAQSVSLIEAIENNNIKEVKTLLSNGADVNAYNSDSDNVLLNAAIYASADCMKLLFQHKAIFSKNILSNNFHSGNIFQPVT